MIYDCARIFRRYPSQNYASVSHFELNFFLFSKPLHLDVMVDRDLYFNTFTSDAMTCGYDRCLVFGISKIAFSLFDCYHRLGFSF